MHKEVKIDVEATKLIKRLRAGDQSIVEDLYRSYRDEFVHFYCREHSISQDDAKDVFQNAIVTFYQKVMNDRLESLTCTVKTYLFSVGRFKSYEWQRAQPKNQVEPNPNLLESIVDDTDVASKLELEEKIILIYQSLRKLGDPCRSLLELFYFQRLSMDEIAALNGYSGGASVKTQKYKCIGRLRKIYKSEMKRAS